MKHLPAFCGYRATTARYFGKEFEKDPERKAEFDERVKETEKRQNEKRVSYRVIKREYHNVDCREGG
jgi:hypothetical protein